MRWQSFSRCFTVTHAAEALFLVPPPRQRPRARCAQCGRVLSLTHAWLMVCPLTREDWCQTTVETRDPYEGDAWCEDCAHTWFGVNLLATDAAASATEYLGAVIRSEVTRVHDTGRGFVRRLPPGWRSRVRGLAFVTLSVTARGKEATSAMAFVRWRGNCAQLLATITVDGRPRQRLLVNLQGAYRTTPQLRKRITKCFPDIPVDWMAVDRSLAQGPPSATPPTNQQLQWADTAHQLSVWATTSDDRDDRRILTMAAEILTRWQSSR